MADIRLAKPAAGTTQTVPSAPDGRFIFDFPADAATLTRSGDNLVLTFEDGASIQLQDFYTTYSKEEMPSFQVEGVEISGQDFFAALGEDLMPAAGPAAGSSASRSGRYNEYGGSDLLDGLDHLGRLDIGFDGGVQLATDTVEPSPYYEDDHGVTVTPSAPGTDPDDPDIPVQGEDFPPTMPHDVLQVDESALDGGSGGGSATADGSMSVSAPDGVATITIGGVVVWQNGALTGNPVQTDEGHLDVTGFDGTNLTYTYTLDKATQEHGKEGGGENDAIAHEMEVVVTDSDGDSGSAVIRVEITDDVPVAYDNVNSVTENASASGNVLTDVDSAGKTDSFGADGGSGVTWDLSGYTNQEGGTDGTYTVTDGVYTVYTQYGVATLNPDGSYMFTAKADAGLTSGESASVGFGYTIKDSDGDSAAANLTITINGDSNVPTIGIAKPDTGDANIMVDEGALDGGSKQHTEHGASGSGSFTVQLNGEDGVITVGGENGWKVTVTGDSADVTGSVVTVNGVAVTVTGATQGEDGWTVNYSYALSGDQQHGTPGTGDYHTDELTGSIAISVTDATGDTESGTLTVEVHDDGPVAYDDVNSLAEEAESVSGNVLENDKSGADGWRTDADGNITAVELSSSADGMYGTLMLNADGSYTYTRNGTGVPDGGASDTFTYIAYDADGDAVEKTLTITIENTDPTAPGGEGHTLTVTLSDADAAGENTDTVNQNVDLFDGPEAFTSAVFGSTENIVVSGGESFKWRVSADGKLIGTGAESGAVVTLEITGINADGTVTVSATLDDPAHHNDGSDSLNISGIVITATDAGGSTVSGTMNVVVTDDAVGVKVIKNPSLTVDESYADNDAGPGLELKDSVNTDTASLNVSDLFSVDAGADGEASRKYTLSIGDDVTTGQKVLVGGSQYDLTLVKNNDGSISGVAGDENGTVIFNITISNDGNVTLDMTGYGSLVHPNGGSTAQKHDEALSITGVEVTLTVTDTDGDSDRASADLVLTFEDDGPGLTVITDEVPDAPDTPVNNLGSGEAFSFVLDTPEKPDASDYERGEDDPDYKTALQEYNKAIAVAKQEAADMAGQSVASNILSENGWDGVSIYAGKVTYNTDGIVQELDTPNGYTLQYSNYASSDFTVDDKPAADWGIMVASPDDDTDAWADDRYETNVIDDNASEAIVIDLGGQLAYGIELSFGAFYSNYHGTEGAEKLLITFYKGSEIVESRFVDSVDIGSSNTGKVTYSTDLIAGGFDKVVISAVLGEGGRESSFTLQGVDFVTAPSAIAVASGELDVASGADGYAEAFAVANVQFAMEQMFSLQTDGTYSLSILDGTNVPQTAIVTVMTDDLGNSRLTATVDGKELFSATLEKDGDGWSWKMEQYQEFKVVGADGASSTTFELQFITKDGDGDTTVGAASIELVVVTDPVITIADEDATLTTDESYISSAADQPAGSGTVPAAGDGSASSAQDSGSFSVNLNGMAYTLVIEGRNDTSLTLHFDKEGNLVSEDGTSIGLEDIKAVVSSTYGDLTITSVDAEDGTLTVTYTYTQDKAFAHPEYDNAIDAKADDADGFTVTVTDTAGNSTAGTISVTIEDDGPVITAENPASVHAAHTQEGIVEGTFTVNHGADGAQSTAFSYTDEDGNVHTLSQQTTITTSGEGLPEGVSVVGLAPTETRGEPQTTIGAERWESLRAYRDVTTKTEVTRTYTTDDGYVITETYVETSVQQQQKWPWSDWNASGEPEVSTSDSVYTWTHTETPTEPTYVYQDDDYTVTVVQGATDDSGNTQYSYKVEYDSTTVGEGFEGTLSVSATDGDFDTAVKDISITVSNDAPVATDDSFTIYKEVEGTHTVSASASATLPVSMITVGGRSELDETYVKWAEGNNHGEHTAIQDSAGRNALFGEVFTDLGDNKLTMEQLAGAANIYVYDGGNLETAVEYASQNELLLYIKGDLTTSDLNGQPLSCVTIVTGDLTVDSDTSINSFLYVAGDATIGEKGEDIKLTVSGGLAVAGNLDVNTGWAGSVSVEVEHTADEFTPSNVIISEEVESTDQPEAHLSISFDELLKNDSDDDSTEPAHDGMEISSITINGTDYTMDNDCSGIHYSETTTISIDWTEGTIEVTNTGENSESIGFDYTVQDFHGATDTASVTVNVSANTGAGSMGDDLIQGATSTMVEGTTNNIVLILDRSGSMGSGWGSSYHNYLPDAKNALISFVESLLAEAKETNSTVHIDFVTFSSNATISFSGELTDSSIQELKSAISSTEASGGTNYTRAFNAAIDALKNKEGQNNQVYFITDGEPDPSWENGEEQFEDLDVISDIHAVGIGSDQSLENKLKEYDSDHSPIMVEDPSDLTQALQSITHNLPAADTIFSSAGDDVVFGDAARMYLHGKEVTLATYVAAMLGTVPSTKEVLDYVHEHAEEINANLVVNTDDKNPDQPDALLGGTGNDVLFGQGGDDLLIGDGSDAASGSGAQDTLDLLIERYDLTPQGDNTSVTTQQIVDAIHDDSDNLSTWLEGLENGGAAGADKADGNDILFGGSGNDVIFGMGGDDFIDGGSGRDTIYAGSGNDIIVYDSNDYLVSGGSGIDFMVSDDSMLTMDTLLGGGQNGNKGPIVDSIEVLITGTDALSLTSLEQMAEKYGITINGSSLELKNDLWTVDGDGYRFTGDLDSDGTPDDLFLQVNSKTDAHVSVELVSSDDIAEAMQRAEIEHSNG